MKVLFWVIVFSFQCALVSGFEVEKTRIVDDPIETYTEECTGVDSIECDVLRSLVVGDLIENLEMMERGSDNRNLYAAREAFEVPDIRVKIAALKVLGQKVDQVPDMVDAVGELLKTENLFLQYYAARFIQRSKQSQWTRLANQFLNNHASQVPDMDEFYAETAHPDLKEGQFQAFPNSTPSILLDIVKEKFQVAGFTCDASIDEVLAFYKNQTQGKLLTMEEALEFQSEQNMTFQNDYLSDPLFKDFERMTAELIKNPTQETAGRIEKKNIELKEKFNNLEMSPLYQLVPGGGFDEDLWKTAKLSYLDMKLHSPYRVIMVYFDALLGKTVVQLGWWTPNVVPAAAN